jgi:hypothetical protein|tara:strand:- start:59 stop:427 length:369 start_codon:yes stop_codon:yes gene_type:complete
MNIAKLLEYYWPGCLWELVGNDQTDYKNLTWLDTSTKKPTESELLAKKDEGELREALDEIRPIRNRLLKESDWTQMPDISDSRMDSTTKGKWQVYREELRDLTKGLDTVDKVKKVTWPTEPS